MNRLAFVVAVLASCSAPEMAPVPDVPDAAAPDLARAGLDLRLPCGGACAAPTPFCDEHERCAACLGDGDCPAGTWCGMPPGGGALSCLPGCGSDARCAGMGAGSRCCQGLCVDTATDPDHCGGCGAACRIDHAAASCVAGACTIAGCHPGWADCDRAPGNGCEVNTRLDIANCGMCGAACSAPHATAACAGTCYLAQCDFGFDDCNSDPVDGCEVPIESDARNCGGCGMACGGLAHARVGCINAHCAPTGCDPGFDDCDRAPVNGCETSLASDAKNCGKCGAVCPQGLVCRNSSCTCPNCNFANARSMCVNNQCVMGACDAGFANCDNNPANGCEIDLTTDVRNCGQCGLVCPNNQPTCANSMCTQCMITIANAGMGDFQIKFTVQTAAAVQSTVIYQRSICSHGNFWEVRMSPAGLLGVEFDDNNVAYTTLTSVSRVNDNAPHAVEIKRVAGTLRLSVNSVEEVSKPCATTIGALSPLGYVMGSPCEGRDGTQALVGQVTGVCLSVP